ncbi:hypothetical protein ATY41_08480 [Leifsonia xyli subsp. xyli]|uniref:HTH tetR-type domain-containing protein n=1 Tax=Leifsonia xyli subsp. xyli TaxID=59736 RepID=A0A1E2SLT8_LEIXY|nr:hypothetical protein ATY41_08480 [Leifsonia xyli subsp. xyli]
MPLTRQCIVDTALGIIAKRDFDGLTMRALAQELDTGPAALCIYFGNRKSMQPTPIERDRWAIRTLIARIAANQSVDEPGFKSIPEK